MIGPTNRKNWLTFGGEPIPDTDSELVFIARQHTDVQYWYSNSVHLSVCLSLRDVPVLDENGLI